MKHLDKYIVTGTLILIAFTALTINFVMMQSIKEVSTLADEVIRFHVVANSDTMEDQLLKQRVKDEVIAYIEPLTKTCRDINETRQLIKEQLEPIKEIAEKVVSDYQKDYEVYVTLDTANFPTKAYGDVVFPAGKYEACRIIIGEGKGENWWCVMYPPLCYIDAASGVVPLEGKEQLEEGLTEEQYQLVTNKENKRYHIRFKIVDTINAWLFEENYKEK